MREKTCCRNARRKNTCDKYFHSLPDVTMYRDIPLSQHTRNNLTRPLPLPLAWLANVKLRHCESVGFSCRTPSHGIKQTNHFIHKQYISRDDCTIALSDADIKSGWSEQGALPKQFTTHSTGQSKHLKASSNANSKWRSTNAGLILPSQNTPSTQSMLNCLRK